LGGKNFEPTWERRCHEEGPVNEQGAIGALKSVYCRDPDGSLIEISAYED